MQVINFVFLSDNHCIEFAICFNIANSYDITWKALRLANTFCTVYTFFEIEKCNEFSVRN